MLALYEKSRSLFSTDSNVLAFARQRHAISGCLRHALSPISEALEFVECGRLMALRLNQVMMLVGPPAFAFSIGRHLSNSIKESSRSRMTEAIRECGPTLVKLCQWISTRPDMFQSEWIDALSVFHSDPEFSSQHRTRFSESRIRKVLDQNFGAARAARLQICVDRLGQPVLLGRGSLSTVARALLVDGNSSRDVVIKMIDESDLKQIRADLKLVEFLGRAVSVFSPSLRNIGICESLNVFHDFMNRQLDLRIEHENLVRLREEFAREAPIRRSITESKFVSSFPRLREMICRTFGISSMRKVHFPEPIAEFKSEHVLVEEFCPGAALSDLLRSSRADHTTAQHRKLSKEICAVGTDMFLKMLFRHNFVHADLHPGNIIVRTNPGSSVPSSSQPLAPLNRISSHLDRISVIDAGLCTSLTDRDMKNFKDLLHCVVTRQAHRCGELIIERSAQPEGIRNQAEYVRKVAHLVSQVSLREVATGSVDLSRLLTNLLSYSLQHNVKLEPNFTTVVVAIAVLEGLGKTLDPSRNLFWDAKRYILEPSVEKVLGNSDDHLIPTFY